MPDMKEALRQAGLRVSSKERGGRDGGSGRERPRTENAFPTGYPRYFTDEGHTRPELVKEEAEKIAGRFYADRLKRHQLRWFYDHAKRQYQRLQYGTSFGAVHADIARLKAFAADRAGRSNNPIPASFKQFIDSNVDAVMDERSFSEGFIPHFEAVVAYCARLGE
jgi:CRISPR-associated protein Csm2